MSTGQPFGPELFAEGSTNVFVFESTKAGRLSSPTARFALEHCGAAENQIHGWHERSYAIPVFEHSAVPIGFGELESLIRQLYHFSQQNQQFTFYVPRIACRLLCYSDIQIAPLFADFGDRFVLPTSWQINNISLQNNSLTPLLP